jgi:hypothetical protein
LFFGNETKLRFLGEKASARPDGILDRSLFPAMRGLAEVEVSLQHFVSVLMLYGFGTIIMSDGTPEGLGDAGPACG